ncbi:MAG TPA: zinc ribbon domain-containing protein [Anaerolineae bacterium]|nr:zinc ribbon domain-containing protein [Anaerolineae bacterium]HIQ06517.1 zinc ribbon domain-containing protein [Anaerolineae bacterium]
MLISIVRWLLMPLYEYQCDDCQCCFELLRLAGQADAAAPCPQCGGVQTHRLLSRFAAFSRGGNGEASRSLAGSSCSGCAATSCSACRVSTH